MSLVALPQSQSTQKTGEADIKVLLAEELSQNSSLILDSLSKLKECTFIRCTDLRQLVPQAMELKPHLLLINHDIIQENPLTVLNLLRHQNENAIIFVYLTAALEETRNAILMAGASECLVLAPEDLHLLAGHVKKALITISERACFQENAKPATEEIPDIVFSLDLEGRIVFMNSAVAHLLGYDAESIINSQFTDFISNDIHRQKFEAFRRNAEQTVTFDQILTLQTSLGIDEDFQLSLTLMEGEILCGTARKIGLQISPGDWKQEAEAEERQLDRDESGLLFRESDSDEAVPVVLGPYSVTGILGQGAMGRVYKGFDEHLERYVAIKMINRALAADEEHLERFKREARLLASISHPNIALIYYFDVWNKLPFFCMEYLPEGSLDQLLKEKKTLDPQTAILFVQQVSLGLKKAQEKGVVHLDIKPSNLMIAEKNRIKIVDFGLAATHCELQENSDTIIGTPAYLAPEQLNDGTIDHRCDIYSLGITFYEMLYGHLPYTGSTVKEIFSKKLSQDIPAASMLNPDVPMAIYELIRKMLERDPAKRIQNYTELIDKLEETRRTLQDPAPVTLAPATERAVRMRGNLFDTAFAEVLGEIWVQRLSGRLTLHWLDLTKVIHFKNGIIHAVLSNQEGERFIDLLISEKHLKPNEGWKIQTARSDLFTKYSSAMDLVAQENRENLSLEFETLAWKILESLFSWGAGDFLFEEGDYPEQTKLEILTSDVIAQGVRHHTDPVVISRKLKLGHIKITMVAQCASRMRQVRLTASERFLLLKTENGISFTEMHSLSNLPRDMFSRLLYLFVCLELVHIEPYREQVFQHETPAPQPANNSTPAKEITENKNVQIPDTLKPPVAAAGGSEPYFRQALEEYKQRNYWPAVQLCKKALESKQDARVYHLMGRALAKHPGFKFDAMKALKSAQELNPKDITIERDIADLYFVSENIALAEFHYKKVLATEPLDKHSRQKLRELAHRNDIGKVVGKVGKTLGKWLGGNRA